MTEFKNEELIIGFVDETSQEVNPNTVRFWSYTKPVLKKKTAYLRVNSVGAYLINGCSVITFPERTRTIEFCEFLDEVRNKNPYSTICLILDNYPVHKARAVQMKAKKMNIILINLPRYSPDLNPIEYIWKSIKRVLSDKCLNDRLEIAAVVQESFFSLGFQLSFVKRWCENFLDDNLNMLC